MSQEYKITAAQLKDRGKDSVLLDVRDEMSFQYGHINDAINLPLEQLKEQLQQNKKFEQFRLDTFDLALTNYRDYNRKRVGFDFAYRFLSMVYDEIQNL